MKTWREYVDEILSKIKPDHSLADVVQLTEDTLPEGSEFDVVPMLGGEYRIVIYRLDVKPEEV